MNLNNFFSKLVPSSGQDDEGIVKETVPTISTSLIGEDASLPTEELIIAELPLLNETYKSKWKGSEIDEAIEDSNHHINSEPQDNPHNTLPKLSQVITKSSSDWVQEGEKFQTTITIPNFNEELVIYINYAAETKEYAVKSGIGNNEVLINEDGVITLQADRIPLEDIKIVIAWQPMIETGE